MRLLLEFVAWAGLGLAAATMAGGLVVTVVLVCAIVDEFAFRPIREGLRRTREETDNRRQVEALLSDVEGE